MSQQLDKIRCITHNVRGLNESNLKIFINLIEKKEQDVIILLETWHCMETIYVSHPTYVASSPKGVRNGSRYNHGILVLRHPDIQRTVTYCSENYIRFTIFDVVITATYLQPSLTDQDIENELRKPQLQATDILVGDVNYLIYDCPARQRGQSQRVRNYCTNNFMNIIEATEIPNLTSPQKLDHLYSRIPDVEWTYRNSITALDIVSDHSAMFITIPKKVIGDINIDEQTLRIPVIYLLSSDSDKKKT